MAFNLPTLPEPTVAPMPHFQIRSATILVIDDEADVTAALARCLHEAGYRCQEAHCAAAAVNWIGQRTPELVICDINLGGESGLDLCEYIQCLPGMADVPVMFLSGAQAPDVIRRSHAAGGAYYLRKPFAPQVLLELVEKALRLPPVAVGPTAPAVG